MPDVAPVIKPALDENLPPIKKFSLRQWNAKFQELTTDADLIPRDVFALTGHYVSRRDGQVYRALLNDDTCRLDESDVIRQTCDIDSVLGVVENDFPIADNVTFKYFMLPSFTHTLNADLHIPGVRVFGQELEEEPVQLHKLPNARFGEMGDGFLIRIFFPELRHELQETLAPNFVNEGRLKAFYDRAVHPAAIEIMPDDLVRAWPPTFEDEMFRATNAPRGREGVRPEDRRKLPQHTSRDVHAQYLNAWIDAIRRRVTEEHSLEFARGFFFLVEGKGTKNRDGIRHAPPTEDLVDEDGELVDPDNDRTRAVNHLLRDFDTALFQPDDWYLDIATTFSGEDEGGHPFCVFASPDSHPEIIEHFSDTPIAQCEHFVESKSGGYQRDEVAHTGVFAGFRIPFRDPGEDGTSYLQVYSSEKSISYRLDALKKTKTTSVHGILDNWQAERESFFVLLQSAFTNASSTHSVALRIESRVRFDCYPHAHHEVPEAHLRPWLRCTNNSAFWGFKAKRLMAISNVLNKAMVARESFSLDQLPEVGSLLVLLPWMANALLHRPEEGSHWDEVSHAGSVAVARAGQVVPDRPLAVYYLHSLRLRSEPLVLPRLSSHRTISRDVIVYLFQTAKVKLSELEVWAVIRGEKQAAPRPPGDPWPQHPDEPSGSLARLVPKQANKHRKVLCRLASEAPDVFEDALPQPQRRRGYESEDEDPEEREAPMSISKRVTAIFHNYPLQIFRKVSNKRGKNESWCTLSRSERQKIQDDIFCHRSEPRRVFSSYMDFGFDQDRWTKTVDVLFPTREEHPHLRDAKIQGLHQLCHNLFFRQKGAKEMSTKGLDEVFLWLRIEGLKAQW